MNKNALLRIVTFTSLILILMPALSCKAADVTFLGAKNGAGLVLFDGLIQSGDLAKLKYEYKKGLKESPIIYLVLASPGGSVDEAMKIGDFLDQEQIGAMVLPQMGECNSACVFILAGAEDKIVKGKVGIHRPYISDVSIGGEQGAKTLGKYIETIKIYLDAKGIAPSLADDMFSIPPEKIKYLSQNELARYRLDQKNYLKQENIDIEIARSYGLTRQEYMQKKIQMTRECSGLSHEQMYQCTLRIMGPKIAK